MAGTQGLSGDPCGFAPRQNTARSSAWGSTAQAALTRARTRHTCPHHQGFPPPQGCAGLPQGHPQDTATSKRGSLPRRADHGEIRMAERCKGSRATASRARGETDPPKASRQGAGVGVRTAAPGSVCWRSRRCRSPVRTHGLVREETTWLCLVMLISTFPLHPQGLGSCKEQPNPQVWPWVEGPGTSYGDAQQKSGSMDLLPAWK